MDKHKHQKIRPTLVLQWLIIAVILMIVLSWFKLSWWFFFFPLFFWGGCWRVDWYENEKSDFDETDKVKNDDDIDYV